MPRSLVSKEKRAAQRALEDKFDRALSLAATLSTQLSKTVYILLNSVIDRKTGSEVGANVLPVTGAIGDQILHEPNVFMPSHMLQEARNAGILVEP